VIKVHNNPSIFNDACAERVIWMDERFDVLYCAPEKGDATKKRFPVEDILEVQNLGNRRDRVCINIFALEYVHFHYRLCTVCRICLLGILLYVD
jgi:hypothetical protein